MTSAQKATKTRKARQAFRNHYGDESYNVVKRIVQGERTETIERNTWTPMVSIDAYRANVTRGTYDHLLADCNF